MKKSKFIALAAVVSFLLAAVPAAAVAAAGPTEAGNGCAGVPAETESLAFIGASNGPGAPLPATISTAGVITSWTTNLGQLSGPPPAPLEAQLQVYQPTFGGREVRLVGESRPIILQTSTTGSVKTTGTTRIPVLPGDQIADVGAAHLPTEVDRLNYYCTGLSTTVSVGGIEKAMEIGEEGPSSAPRRKRRWPRPCRSSLTPTATVSATSPRTRRPATRSSTFPAPRPPRHRRVRLARAPRRAP